MKHRIAHANPPHPPQIFASDLPPLQDAVRGVVIIDDAIKASDEELDKFLTAAMAEDPKARPSASELLGHAFLQSSCEFWRSKTGPSH